MSQHCYTTQLDGQAVEIVMGWDRPLQGFFLTVDRVDTPRGTHDERPIYCSLWDPQLHRTRGLSTELNYLQRKLAELGLHVPPQMLHEIGMDRDENAGNRYVLYDAAGACTEALC